LAWKAPGIGRSLIFMTGQGFVWLVVLGLVESGSFRRAVRQACVNSQDVETTVHDAEDGAMWPQNASESPEHPQSVWQPQTPWCCAS